MKTTPSVEILLHRAIREGNKEAVTSLLDAGVSVNLPDILLGNSPFHGAVLNGQLEIADLLLSRGADPHQANRYGNTALYTELRAGRVAHLDYLLDHGADIFVVDEKGNTFLHRLVENYSIYNLQNPGENAAAGDIVRGIEWLLAQGVDVRAKNGAGQDAEDLAGDAPELLNKIRVLKAKAAIDAAIKNPLKPG